MHFNVFRKWEWYWIGLYTDTPCNACISNQNSLACISCRQNWYWLDGEPYVFNSWCQPDPNNNVKCGALGWRPGYNFADSLCDSNIYFICKKRGNIFCHLF